MYSKTIILFLLFSFQMVLGRAQECETLEGLYKQGKEEKKVENYPRAFEILTELEQKAAEKQCYDLLIKVKVIIGAIYSDLSKNGQALDYHQQALGIAREHPELSKHIPRLIHNIGYLESVQKNDNKAFELYRKAYEAAKQYNSHFWVAISLADVYAEKGVPETGLKYLEEIREKVKEEDEGYQQRWKITYAEILYQLGERDRAQKIAEALLLETQKNQRELCNICVLNLLSQVYAKQGELDKAIAYAKEGLQNTNVLTYKIELYEKLADFYLLKQNYDLAFRYKDSIITAKDSSVIINNRHLFRINRIKFKVQEYQNEIKQNQQKQRAERILFFLLIGFGLLTFFFVFKTLRNRIQKQKQRGVIAENKQRITALQFENEKKEHRLLEEQLRSKQEKLKNKISKKNRMLSANALYHSGRNELLEKIISSLSNISEVSRNKAINDYIKELKSHLKTDSKWKDFITHFEKVNPGFLKKLKSKHPQLTKKDIRFLCYLYMNLSTSEICTILNITSEAFRKRKQRLAEKMGLQKGKLYDYILSL